MTIHVGGNQITDIKIGSQQINSVWVGGNKVWDRIVDTQTVTVGARYIYMFGTYAGYSSGGGVSWTGAFGSISDGTADWAGGAIIDDLYRSPFGGWLLTLRGAHPNSGFEKVTIQGVDYQRSSATYSQQIGSSGQIEGTYWSFPTGTPFNVTGNIDVVFHS